LASIVVVGGGLAGLSCAWRLQRAGHDVEVLEREPVAGGRMRSERHGDFTVERGAQFVAGGYRNLHAVARTLEIDQQLLPHAPARDAVLHHGKLHGVDFSTPWRLLTSPLVGARGAWGLLRVASLVLRQRRRLDPLRPELAAGLDGEDLVTGLRPLLGAEVFDRLVAPTFAATFDEEPEKLSLAFGLLTLRLFASGLSLQSFAGGNGLLTDTLARQLPVLTGCDVVSVETETDGARIRYRRLGRESSVFADAVVVAVPGSRVAALCPKLVPDERGFFEAVHYTRGIIVHLLLDDAPPSLPYGGVAFPRSEGLDLYGIAVAHHKAGAAPPGAGSLNAALTAQACERAWREPDAALGELVRANLARTPVGELGAGKAVVHRWSDLLPRFAPGHLQRLAAFQRRLERSPRMVFAGDYLVGPTTEGALTSGMRAATEIARSL
jgi:oxygen-dependent protoporphyrinogen oxidase